MPTDETTAREAPSVTLTAAQTHDLVRVRLITDALSRGVSWARIASTLGYGADEGAKGRAKRDHKRLCRQLNVSLRTTATARADEPGQDGQA